MGLSGQALDLATDEAWQVRIMPLRGDRGLDTVLRNLLAQLIELLVVYRDWLGQDHVLYAGAHIQYGLIVHDIRPQGDFYHMLRLRRIVQLAKVFMSPIVKRGEYRYVWPGQSQPADTILRPREKRVHNSCYIPQRAVGGIFRPNVKSPVAPIPYESDVMSERLLYSYDRRRQYWPAESQVELSVLDESRLCKAACTRNRATNGG